MPGRTLGLLGALAIVAGGVLAAAVPLAVAGVLAGLLLAMGRTDRVRAAGSLVPFAGALAYCALFWTPAWPLGLATLGALAGLVASFIALPRRDPWRGTYF